ncbi:MAG TPA: ankyrin repeat domain-containing protein [Pirellulales bacterium]|nr:ankyrin repeat domain-containing protein [Pirellulales bacterium]
MGLFCVNVHFRTTDDHALSASLNKRSVTRYRIVPAKNGWTSLYEERASEQDDRRIRDLAGGLSEDLHVAAIAFLVHDSDIACYWLFDDGQLLDEYNSYPNYFDDDADGPPSPSGGRTEVLVRYCQTGVQEDQLTAILRGEALFAEDVIAGLAQALGIDRKRAIADYRDGGRAADGGDGADDEGDGGDDEGDDDDGGLNVARRVKGLAGPLAQMLGFGPRATDADPQALALVQAATDDDPDEIARLLAAGVAVDAEAPAPLPGGQLFAGLGQLLPGGAPKIAMTPLLAAIVHKRRRAAERLLDGGADPNRVHALFGTPVHAATGAGEADLLKLLIDHGGDVNARDAKGQTPLQVIAVGRASLDRLAQMKSLGDKLPPGFPEKLLNVTLPTAGWDACERLLKAQMAK